MFVRLKRTPNSPKTAVQLVENLRQGNKVKQKVVRHFGYALNEEEIEALKKLALKYKLELIEQQKGLFLFPKETLLERIQSAAHKENERDLPVNLCHIRQQEYVCMGVHMAYGELFKQLGFHRVLKNWSRSKASVRMLLHMVMARIASPQSKRASVHLLERAYGVKLDVNAVYRMMDKLDEAAIAKIQQQSYGYVKDILGEALNVIFYDGTTLYFETLAEDELKPQGYSKDGKFHQSQVLLALMVTQAGLPVRYELFEGNTFEGHTLQQAIERLQKHYLIGRVVFVADSALLSKSNMALLQAAQQEFIVGARLNGFSKEITEKILNKALYHKWDEEQESSYQEIELGAEGLRLIVSYSAARAAKDAKDREKAVESLKKRLERSQDIRSLLNNYGYKKYIKTEGTEANRMVVDEEKIRQDAQWDGLHGVITNISKERMSAAGVLEHYHGLWQIEETFRISKHDLRIRPIFHWTPRRIQAHMAICFMALMCVRLLEYRTRLQYKKMSSKAINTALQEVKCGVYQDLQTKKKYVIPSKIPQDAKKILQIMGLQWRETPYELK